MTGHVTGVEPPVPVRVKVAGAESAARGRVDSDEPAYLGQRRRSQPAFIIIMIMKLVSVCGPC